MNIIQCFSKRKESKEVQGEGKRRKEGKKKETTEERRSRTWNAGGKEEGRIEGMGNMEK